MDRAAWARGAQGVHGAKHPKALAKSNAKKQVVLGGSWALGCRDPPNSPGAPGSSRWAVGPIALRTTAQSTPQPAAQETLPQIFSLYPLPRTRCLGSKPSLARCQVTLNMRIRGQHFRFRIACDNQAHHWGLTASMALFGQQLRPPQTPSGPQEAPVPARTPARRLSCLPLPHRLNQDLRAESRLATRPHSSVNLLPKYLLQWIFEKLQRAFSGSLSGLLSDRIAAFCTVLLWTQLSCKRVLLSTWAELGPHPLRPAAWGSLHSTFPFGCSPVHSSLPHCSLTHPLTCPLIHSTSTHSPTYSYVTHTIHSHVHSLSIHSHIHSFTHLPTPSFSSPITP